MPPRSQDQQLSTWIERAGAGDPRALEHLLSTHSARLASHISPKLPAPMQGAVDVDDILQQTFLEVFRSIDHFEPRGDDSFWSWIVAIANARLRDAVKAQNGYLVRPSTAFLSSPVTDTTHGFSTRRGVSLDFKRMAPYGRACPDLCCRPRREVRSISRRVIKTSLIKGSLQVMRRFRLLS